MRHDTPTTTAAVFLFTSLMTALGLLFPQVEEDLARTPATLTDHQWWRLVTPVLINRGGWAPIAFNLAGLAVIGAVAERVWGPRLWAIFYLVGAVVGEIAGLVWQPFGAGCSVAVCGLLGSVGVWLLRVPTVRARVGGLVILGGATALAAARDLHGPPLLAGALAAGTVCFFKRGPKQ